MSSDALSPEQEAQLIGELLRDQVGVDPEKLRPVVDLAALGLVNSAWRNSPVEDWHADGRLSDADMLRINSHSTWRVRQRLVGWLAETGLPADGPASDLDRVPAADVDLLAFRLFRWLVNPRRKLPTGMTLGELAHGGLHDYESHADRALGSFAAQAELRGARFGFMRAAGHGGPACSHWWGIRAGLPWSAGSSRPSMIRLTSTGAQMASTRRSCRPSRSWWQTGDRCGRSS